MIRRLALAGAFFGAALPAAAQPAGGLDEATITRLGSLALACVHQEYPNKIAHVLDGDADVLPPRQLTPAFFGCFDWHSAVHGHWMLARLARLSPGAAVAAPARAALAKSLTPDNVAGEVRYLERKGRESFERPYGMAWLLQLAAELREWQDGEAQSWAAALRPLEQLVVARLKAWLPKLSHPIRTGEHSQTAFAFGLIVDFARVAKDEELEALVRARGHAFHFHDRNCPLLAYEPSGQDFLSPCLAVADLARRFMPPARFGAWLGGFLPGLPLDGGADWLPVAVVTDPTDGKLAHLDGLNLSRAWMLEGIAAGLPAGDPRLPALLAAAAVHRADGLASVTGEHYEGGHWLGSFATYLVTGRGLAAGATAPSPGR